MSDNRVDINRDTPINDGDTTSKISLRILTSDGSTSQVYINDIDSGKTTKDTIVLDKRTLSDTSISLVNEVINYNEVYRIGYDGNTIKVVREINGSEIDITNRTDNVYELLFTPIKTITNTVDTIECIKYLVRPIADTTTEDTTQTSETIISSNDNTSTQLSVIPTIEYTDCSGIRTPLVVDKEYIIYAKKDSILTTEGNVFISQQLKEEVVDDGVIPIEYSTITVNVNGEEDSVSVVSSVNETFILSDIQNRIEGRSGSVYTIKSANTSIWYINKITVIDENGVPTEYTTEDGESLSIAIPLRDNLVINVDSKLVVYSVNAEVTVKETSIRYNVNDTNELFIRTFPTNTEIIRAIVGDREYRYRITEFDGTEDGIPFYDLRIPTQAIQSVKDYSVSIVPINKYGEGRGISVSLSVVDEIFIDTPDLFDISYPSKLQGPDFVGTNVPFTINWESKNTSYVKVYYGTQRSLYLTETSNSITLNVGDILKDIPTTDIRTDGEFNYFTVTLIPVNVDGFDDIVGKEEVLEIGFSAGDLTIPREIAIKRLLDTFVNELDTSIFDNNVNNLLNHYIHLGDGQNLLVSNWIGSRDNSLILKLYEPLPTDIVVNQPLWVSKIQSNPTIQTVTIFGEVDDNYPFIKGPNLSIEVDGGTAYQMVENILGSTSTTTSEKLITEYVNKSGIDISSLDIRYADDSRILYENFVHFGSAAERVVNFQYKVVLIEEYTNKISDIENSGASSTSIVSAKEIEKNKNLRRELIGGFDGFEKFLYTDTSSLSYPKDINGNLLPTNDSSVQSWFNGIVAEAQEYDINNVNYLVNNIPSHIVNDGEGREFILFLDMIGQHFDILWSYTNGITRSKKVRENTKDGISNKLIYHMLESFGWSPKRPFDTTLLWEAAFGENKDGSPLYGTSLETAGNEVWKRILNNLPYLLKHKGTRRALNAMMSCYGVPSSLLTIFEFGGPTNQKSSENTKFTFDDNTFSIVFDGNSTIETEWKVYDTDHPTSIELRVNTTELTTQSLLKTDGWELSLVPTNTGSYGVLQLDIDNQSISTDPMPLFTDEYNHIVVNKNSGSIDVFALRTDIDTIKQTVSASIATTNGWDSGSVLEIGSTFVGLMDEFRLWKTPLELRVIQNQALFPQSIQGNELQSSTEDLLFRLDFELPRNRHTSGDTSINNVSINQTYSTSATAVGFPLVTDYPYNYINYTRLVSATIPSVGFLYSNKVRIEDQTLVSDLSYKQRATLKAFDREPIDSNRLGIFLSPTKELNLDIIKSFGDNLSIDDLIGNPSDSYKDTYGGLSTLRGYYFNRLNRNIYEYINLVRYIDKSLFDTLADLVPVRAKVSKGLLIEPHILERSKVRWTKPEGVEDTLEGIIDEDDTIYINSEYLENSATIVFQNTEELNGEVSSIDALITYSDTAALNGEDTAYDGLVEYGDTFDTEGTIHSLSSTIVFDTISSLETETSLGLDLSQTINDTFTDIGFGLYAINGTASFFNKSDDTGNTVREYRRVYLIREKIDTTVSSFIPQSGSIDKFIVPIYRTSITTLPIDSTVEITPNDTIISATPINGYVAAHYKNKKIPTGLQNSFYKGSKQTNSTTPDGLPVVEVFTTNPNILKVADTGRGSGEPILKVK